MDQGGHIASTAPGVAGRRQERRHTLAEPRSWPWLPTGHGHLAPHAWCRDCGAVCVTGSHRAMKLGGIVNLLARLETVLESHGHKTTQAQMRLILQKVRRLEADDPFTLTHERQREILADVIGAYLGIGRDVVATYMRSC